MGFCCYSLFILSSGLIRIAACNDEDHIMPPVKDTGHLNDTIVTIGNLGKAHRHKMYEVVAYYYKATLKVRNYHESA